MEINTISEYIAQFSQEDAKRMQLLYATIKEVCPEAEERMSWKMPTFVYCGFNLVHFAKAKHHIGFYPANTGVSMFQDRLKDFVCTKGSIHLDDKKDIPIALIKEIVEFRMKENEQYAIEREEAKKSKKKKEAK